MQRFTVQKNVLKNINLTLLDKPIVFSLTVMDWPDRVDNLIYLFKDQLPLKTPDYTIAVAISNLLKTFKIYMESTAILRRIERCHE